MEFPVEAGLTSLDAFTESKHFDRVYDKVTGKKTSNPKANSRVSRATENEPPPRSGVGRHRNTLPSPERDHDYDDPAHDRELEAQSERSEHVLRAYENERDDPKRRPTASLIGSPRTGRDDRRSSMSYANGGNGYSRSERPNSQPPRGRGYYDEDDESDYDERTGRRTRTTGRGYDADRDREFDREVVETERYRGPARDYDPRRQQNDPYASGAPYAAAGATGAMAPYRRSQTNLSHKTREDGRSKSRRRSRSYSRSRSRSRSRSHSGIRGKLDDHFDTSLQGAGVALAGALVGGFAGREFGGRATKKRDMILGALVGGLGANAAENKFREHKEGGPQGRRREERAYAYGEDRGDYGRSRSNVR